MREDSTSEIVLFDPSESEGGAWLDRSERVETTFGYGRLHLANRIAKTTLALRVYRNYAPGVPALHHAEGRFADLSKWDAADALTAQKAITLELEDGRTGNVFITDLQGSFILSGPLA